MLKQTLEDLKSREISYKALLPTAVSNGIRKVCIKDRWECSWGWNTDRPSRWANHVWKSIRTSGSGGYLIFHRVTTSFWGSRGFSILIYTSFAHHLVFEKVLYLHRYTKYSLLLACNRKISYCPSTKNQWVGIHSNKNEGFENWERWIDKSIHVLQS